MSHRVKLADLSGGDEQTEAGLRAMTTAAGAPVWTEGDELVSDSARAMMVILRDALEMQKKIKRAAAHDEALTK